jgi:hypothetical protein
MPRRRLSTTSTETDLITAYNILRHNGVAIGKRDFICGM